MCVYFNMHILHPKFPSNILTPGVCFIFFLFFPSSQICEQRGKDTGIKWSNSRPWGRKRERGRCPKSVSERRCWYCKYHEVGIWRQKGKTLDGVRSVDLSLKTPGLQPSLQ